MLATIGSAIGLFAATNIDDIVVLTVLFLVLVLLALGAHDLVTGADARDVAAYVAYATGKATTCALPPTCASHRTTTAPNATSA